MHWYQLLKSDIDHTLICISHIIGFWCVSVSSNYVHCGVYVNDLFRLFTFGSIDVQ